MKINNVIIKRVAAKIVHESKMPTSGPRPIAMTEDWTRVVLETFRDINQDE